ncbi:hypothetical protein C3L33_23354, partial [Rhododendron williamsianum]
MAGDLIRDGHGDWVVGFQRKLEAASSSTMAECWALRDGLQLALERNLQGIHVETDSMTLLDLTRSMVSQMQVSPLSFLSSLSLIHQLGKRRNHPKKNIDEGWYSVGMDPASNETKADISAK